MDAVESLGYVGRVPWHGKGVYVGEENVDSEEMIVRAGLAWRVKKQLLFTGESLINSPEYPLSQVPSHVAIVRDSDQQILGVVGKDYKPVQNMDAFSFLDDLVSDGSMRYHTAGSLFGGRKVWALGKIGTEEIVPEDKVDQFLLLVNAHDGSMALRVMWTTVRVVCANTMRVALKGVKHGEGVYLKHTSNIMDRMEQAKQILFKAQDVFTEQTEFSKQLARSRFGKADFEKMASVLIPIEKGASERAKTIVGNSRSKLSALFTDVKQSTAPNTAWAALNAVIEFCNYDRKTRMGKEKDEQGQRFVSSLFGSGNAMMQDAVEYLNEYSKVA